MSRRAYREAHAAAGLCVNCPRPVRPGRARCDHCLATQRKWQARRDGSTTSKLRCTHCRICGAELTGIRRTLCSDECRDVSRYNRKLDPEQYSEGVLVACRVCYDLPHRRGDVGLFSTGDVCPGCGLVRERQAEDLIMVSMASSAGFWAAAIPEAAE